MSIQGPNFAPITTGDYSPVTMVEVGPLRPIDEVSPAARPVGVTGPARALVGRASELAWLHRAMSAGPGAVVQPMHGLGGIGKSALAAGYAAQHAAEYTQIAWINAETSTGVESGLRALAITLEPQLAVLPTEALAERASSWLAAHRGWLLVLDNVTAVSDIAPLMHRLSGGQGRFLITSRKTTGWDRLGAAALRLDVLDACGALELLVDVIGLNECELDGGAQLCVELGFLPLAIEQAGAYIRQNLRDSYEGGGIRAYMELLAATPDRLYAAGDEDMASERTIARIWNVTLDRLADTPLAGQVLRVLAWYAPEAIPVSLLSELAPGRELDEALGRLCAHSMITRVPRNQADAEFQPSISVHRLVQAVTRTADPDPADFHRRRHDIDQARWTAAGLLDAALPADEEPTSWPAWQRLAPHVDAMEGRTDPATDTPFIIHVLHRAGRFHYGQGNLTRAISYLERALSGLSALIGDKQQETLACRNNLASAYESAGNLSEAIALYEQAAADTRHVLGPDHSDSLTARNNLGYAYRTAGDLGRAIPLLEQTVMDACRVHGNDHQETLSFRGNLAGAYQTAGDLDRAVLLYEQVVADASRALGQHHAATLIFRNDLGYAHVASGDPRTAIAVLEHVVADRLRVSGEDHLDSLAARNNLAYAYMIAGDLDTALLLLKHVLADRRRILGDDHPDSLSTNANLASAYRSIGDLERAIPIYEQTLSNTSRVMGTDHPDVLAARNNLAGAYKDAGRLERAVSLYEQSATETLKTLGGNHPSTLAAYFNLGGAHQAAGHLERAICAYEQAVTGARRALGEDHRTTKLFTARLESARKAN